MFDLECEQSVAWDSPDHLHPGGCVDPINYANANFNRRLHEILPLNAFVLDIGCGNGGFIESCLRDGYQAVGLEGSSEPKKRKHMFWPELKDRNLFTCDVTKPFQLFYNDDPVKFDLITSWEFLEHISPDFIDDVMKNTVKHMKPSGFYICSISVGSVEYCDLTYGSEWGVTTTLDHRSLHQNINTIEYWEWLFDEYGFIVRDDLRGSFAEQWIRGPGFGCWSERTESAMLQAESPYDQHASINRVFQYVHV